MGYKDCLPVVEIDRFSLLLKLKAAISITNLILTLPCHCSPKGAFVSQEKEGGGK